MLVNVSQYEIIEALELINSSDSIAVIPHRSPDGDAIGAAIATKLAVESLGKKVECVCIDPPPRNTSFLPETGEFKLELIPQQYELLIFVDCGGHYMSRFHEVHPNLFNGKQNIINIDHHESNDKFGTINLVEPKAASTTHILYHLFKKWGVEITPRMATCLLTGLYFDTGSFRHNNTTPEVLKIASDLTEKGADVSSICKNLFKTNTIKKLRLWGEIFNNTKRTNKKIITAAIKDSDYDELNTSSKDLEGVVDYLNAVPDSKFCILLSEDQKGGVKGSLRTQDKDVDLSQIAELFGGGGHKMASGFRIEANLKEDKQWRIT